MISLQYRGGFRPNTIHTQKRFYPPRQPASPPQERFFWSEKSRSQTQPRCNPFIVTPYTEAFDPFGYFLWNTSKLSSIALLSATLLLIPSCQYAPELPNDAYCGQSDSKNQTHFENIEIKKAPNLLSELTKTHSQNEAEHLIEDYTKKVRKIVEQVAELNIPNIDRIVSSILIVPFIDNGKDTAAAAYGKGDGIIRLVLTKNNTDQYKNYYFFVHEIAHGIATSLSDEMLTSFYKIGWNLKTGEPLFSEKNYAGYYRKNMHQVVGGVSAAEHNLVEKITHYIVWPETFRQEVQLHNKLLTEQYEWIRDNLFCGREFGDLSLKLNECDSYTSRYLKTRIGHEELLVKKSGLIHSNGWVNALDDMCRDALKCIEFIGRYDDKERLKKIYINRGYEWTEAVFAFRNSDMFTLIVGGEIYSDFDAQTLNQHFENYYRENANSPLENRTNHYYQYIRYLISTQSYQEAEKLIDSLNKMKISTAETRLSSEKKTWIENYKAAAVYIATLELLDTQGRKEEAKRVVDKISGDIIKFLVDTVNINDSTNYLLKYKLVVRLMNKYPKTP
ncbi:MAG: hypothetical protein ABIE74_11150 [Pseudomonadota bacterium]